MSSLARLEEGWDGAAPPNFRDLGLYRGSGGRAMRRGRLFRSDHLGSLTPEQARALRMLGMTRVLDLRGGVERHAAACALPDVQVHSLAIEPTIVQVLSALREAGHTLTPQDVVTHMRETYRGFVRHHTRRFAELFNHLLEAREPLVFHCTAGKDRTGFAAALILFALEVPAPVVMHDYLLTNERLQPPAQSRFGLSPEVSAVLWGVQPEFLQAALDTVQRDFGGLEPYLREGLGLGEPERERLRALYLKP